jgi:hypothetical protein
MKNFKKYKRSAIAELRPVTFEEVMFGLDISTISMPVDTVGNKPKQGDMVARNPRNHDDQWLVTKEYFHANFEPFVESEPSPIASGLNFGEAIQALKTGNKVARTGWNGKGMFLFLVPGSTFKVNRAPLLGIYPEGTEINYNAHIDMKTADNKIVPWLASQTDVLAEDWYIVEDNNDEVSPNDETKRIFMASVNLPETNAWDGTIWQNELAIAIDEGCTHIMTQDNELYKILNIGSVKTNKPRCIV